jgi:hypothetical protein
MASEARVVEGSHLRIVVNEGKVTMQELVKALEEAVQGVVHGGCNCGLTGFDVSFVRGDPALAQVGQIENIRGAQLTRS